MKMISLLNGLFWGLILIAGGILLIFGGSIDFKITVGRFIGAAVLFWLAMNLIYAGVKVVNGRNVAELKDAAAQSVEGDRTVYNIAFQNSELDLRAPKTDKVKVSVAFASLDVLVPDDKSLHISSDCAFGKTTFPDGNSVSFGELKYKNTEGEAELRIHISAAFAQVRVRQGSR